MKVSICIGIYGGPKSRDGKSIGKWDIYLDRLLSSIEWQTYKNIEVVISDQSIDDKMLDIIHKWKEELNIKYYKCEAKYGEYGINYNNTISKSTGDIIKIIHQDDYFYDKEAIEIIVNEMKANPDKMWGFHICINVNESENEFYIELENPHYHDGILYGSNSIGSPSNIFIRNCENIELMDEALWELIDCEYYYRLNHKYGSPIFIKQPLVTNRVHNDAFSSDWNERYEITEKEKRYIKDKYAQNSI